MFELGFGIVGLLCLVSIYVKGMVWAAKNLETETFKPKAHRRVVR